MDVTSSFRASKLQTTLVLIFIFVYEASSFSPTGIDLIPLSTSRFSRDLECGMSISKWNEEYKSPDEDDGNDEFVTQEMFLRGMLEDPTVRRKKKGSKEYKPHDNRDSLPFVVKVKTPDPYTPPDEMLKQAKKNTERARKKEKDGPTVRTNLVGMDGKYANSVAASIYSRNSSGSLDKVLGEFKLDKNTNCGDLIEVGDREFEVVTARSQFKYAGGKKFVMVRKILEVKEVTRIAEEASLTRLFQKSSDPPSPPLLD
mmetsp:Transcript_24708/g.51732  ORF Transcript_24708/g.51732 Transcript_24708/m.51732 type:complete len:257 (-) Transcript_24708:218-988(-)